MAKDENWDVTRAASAQGWLRGEPMLEELLDDSVLRALLRSDRIDPVRFRGFLDELRGSVSARTRRDRVDEASSSCPMLPETFRR